MTSSRSEVALLCGGYVAGYFVLWACRGPLLVGERIYIYQVGQLPGNKHDEWFLHILGEKGLFLSPENISRAQNTGQIS